MEMGDPGMGVGAPVEVVGVVREVLVDDCERSLAAAEGDGSFSSLVGVKGSVCATAC